MTLAKPWEKTALAAGCAARCSPPDASLGGGSVGGGGAWRRRSSSPSARYRIVVAVECFGGGRCGGLLGDGSSRSAILPPSEPSPELLRLFQWSAAAAAVQQQQQEEEEERTRRGRESLPKGLSSPDARRGSTRAGRDGSDNDDDDDSHDGGEPCVFQWSVRPAAKKMEPECDDGSGCDPRRPETAPGAGSASRSSPDEDDDEEEDAGAGRSPSPGREAAADETGDSAEDLLEERGGDGERPQEEEDDANDDEEDDLNFLESLARPEADDEGVDARDDIMFDMLYHEDDDEGEDEGEGTAHEARASAAAASPNAASDRASPSAAAAAANPDRDCSHRVDADAGPADRRRWSEGDFGAPEEGRRSSSRSSGGGSWTADPDEGDKDGNDDDGGDEDSGHFVQFLPAMDDADRGWFGEGGPAGRDLLPTPAAGTPADAAGGEDENLLFVPAEAARRRSVTEIDLSSMVLPAPAALGGVSSKAKSAPKRPRITLFGGMQKKGQRIAVS